MTQSWRSETSSHWNSIWKERNSHKKIYLNFYESQEFKKFCNDKRAKLMTDLLNWVVSRFWISDSLQEK